MLRWPRLRALRSSDRALVASNRIGYRNPVSHAVTSAHHQRLVPLHMTHFLIEQQAIHNASTAAQYNVSSRTITLFDSNCKRRQAATPYSDPTTSSCDSLRLVLWASPQRRRKAKSLIVLQQRQMQTSGGYAARSDTLTATHWSLWRHGACCLASQRSAIS